MKAVTTYPSEGLVMICTPSGIEGGTECQPTGPQFDGGL